MKAASTKVPESVSSNQGTSSKVINSKQLSASEKEALEIFAELKISNFFKGLKPSSSYLNARKRHKDKVIKLKEDHTTDQTNLIESYKSLKKEITISIKADAKVLKAHRELLNNESVKLDELVKKYKSTDGVEIPEPDKTDIEILEFSLKKRKDLITFLSKRLMQNQKKFETEKKKFLEIKEKLNSKKSKSLAGENTRFRKLKLIEKERLVTLIANYELKQSILSKSAAAKISPSPEITKTLELKQKVDAEISKLKLKKTRSPKKSNDENNSEDGAQLSLKDDANLILISENGITGTKSLPSSGKDDDDASAAVKEVLDGDKVDFKISYPDVQEINDSNTISNTTIDIESNSAQIVERFMKKKRTLKKRPDLVFGKVKSTSVDTNPKSTEPDEIALPVSKPLVVETNSVNMDVHRVTQSNVTSSEVQQSRQPRKLRERPDLKHRSKSNIPNSESKPGYDVINSQVVSEDVENTFDQRNSLPAPKNEFLLVHDWPMYPSGVKLVLDLFDIGFDLRTDEINTRRVNSKLGLETFQDITNKIASLLKTDKNGILFLNSDEKNSEYKKYTIYFSHSAYIESHAHQTGFKHVNTESNDKTINRCMVFEYGNGLSAVEEEAYFQKLLGFFALLKPQLTYIIDVTYGSILKNVD